MRQLRWAGNMEAQRLADAAYRKLKPRKRPKGKRVPKPKRPFDYWRYMASPEWHATKLLALDRAKHKCDICGAKERLHVHHRTYRRLGREELSDLQVLCQGCHENHHEGEVNGVYDPMTRAYFDSLD